jgi:multidrug transporter EmrE-like cation transporter
VSLSEFTLLLISVLVSIAGQFLLKTGALKLGKVDASNAINLIINMITIPELLFGLTCYGIGAIGYILLLTRVNLSVAAPAVSVSYIFSVLIGYFIFKETIPLIRLVGLSFIITGVILVVWKK